MAITVGFMSLLVERLWVVIPVSPYFSSLASLSITVACVLLGGLIAFLMVWVEFTVIAETSALTFMVAGTFKEIVTGNSPSHPCCLVLAMAVPLALLIASLPAVMAAVIFFGDAFAFINGVGLAVLILGAALFNYNKYKKISTGDLRVGLHKAQSKSPASTPFANS